MGYTSDNFDKDGTLIKFDSFWIDVSRCAAADILRRLGREDITAGRLLEMLGVAGDTADIDGLLCKGTYEQIALAIGKFLRDFGVEISDSEIIKLTLAAYNDNATPEKSSLSVKIYEAFSNGGRKLAVVTTDDSQITHKCLSVLG